MSTASRRRSPVLLSGLIAIAVTGCQTMTTQSARQGPSTTAPGEPSVPTGMAKTDFHREISRDQQFNVHVELARVQESRGNYEEALGEYQKALDVGEKRASVLSGTRLSPEHLALAHRRMAAAYDRMGRFALAEAQYNKALKLAPNDPKVWNDAGYSYYLQNRLPDAERALKTAQNLAPTDSRILTNLGLTLAVAGRTDEALSVLSKAGGQAIGHANLGFILAATGRVDEARLHYQAALNLQPDLASARTALTKLEQSPAAIAQVDATPPGAPTGPLDRNVAAASIGQPPEKPETPNAAPPSAPAIPSTELPGTTVSSPPAPEAAPITNVEPTIAPSQPPAAAEPPASTENAPAPTSSSWIETAPAPAPAAEQPPTAAPTPEAANQPAAPVQEAAPVDSSGQAAQPLTAYPQSQPTTATAGVTVPTPQSATEPPPADPSGMAGQPSATTGAVPLTLSNEPTQTVPQGSATSASSVPGASPQGDDPGYASQADLTNPFPAKLNKLLPKTEGVGGTTGALPNSAANATAGPQDPSAGTTRPSPQGAGAVGIADPGRTMPVRRPPVKSQPAGSLPLQGGPRTVLPSSQGYDPKASAQMPRANMGTTPTYRTQPGLPTKATPQATVPGWSVPKAQSAYPATPSDAAITVPRKASPQAGPSNMIPPTPW